MNNVSHRRYLSLWLRRLPADRVLRTSRLPADRPFVLAGPQKNARVLTAVNDAAARLGLYVGQRFADARAILPTLAFAESAPAEDARFLEQVAEWCERYTPFVGTHPPDGAILDIAGVAHLFGGEKELARDLMRRLTGQGLHAALGIADTVGAAWAVARYGKTAIVASGRTREALLPLPLAALRLDAETLMGLAEMGLHAIGDIATRARAPLAARFGAGLLLRLDQALGGEEEPIAPRLPLAPYTTGQAFPEPLSRDADLLHVLRQLLERLCALLEKRDDGARQVLAQFFAVDGAVRHIAIGTSRPLRDAAQLHRLFADKFANSSWQDEFGYDLMRLSVLAAEPFSASQKHLTENGEGAEFAHLIDRLGARLGQARVLRLIVQDTHVPEFAGAAVPAESAAEFLSRSPLGEEGWGKGGRSDTLALARPLRLLEKAERIEHPVAAFPDSPPARFRWRRVTHDIVRSEGPERIAMPWWRDGEGRAMTRDYFRVEAKNGARFWLYRDGLYDRETKEPHWYLHGFLP